jgi:hypothetical protein
MNTKFNVDDRVKVKESGSVGIVRDVFTNTIGDALYTVAVQTDGVATVMIFSEGMLEVAPEEVKYEHEFEYLDGVVVAKFYEIRDGVKKEIGRGHGHIIHAGKLGVAQAASYALKRIYWDIENEENGYVYEV